MSVSTNYVPRPVQRHYAHVWVLVLAMICIACNSARAQENAANAGTSPPNDYSRGTLVLANNGVAESIPAMRLGTDMDVSVSGTVARIRVTQAFRNTSAHWMAGRYLYPLPDDGAVDSLKMVVGNRVIMGRIERREQARAIYEQAAAKGRKAGLVEQQRPNLFSSSVANVGPGQTVLIAIEYQAPVRQVDGIHSIRLPLVAAPRYVAPHTLDSSAAVNDAHAVTTPVLNPTLGQSINPVSITVHLDPGFVPMDIQSPDHTIAMDGTAQQRTIRLADGETPANRDFVLRWRSAAMEPAVGVFSQRLHGQDYIMATIAPPAPVADTPVPPRDMIFVIDNSGSMGGASMRQAKASLLYALDTLRPVDRFNIIRFDDTTTQLFQQSVAATAEELNVARRFIRELEADGGTEMLPALHLALEDASNDDDQRVRQVVFLTDGAISNEAEMLATLGRDGGRSRVFPVGIGSAPNQYLMTRMAMLGRGTYTNVGSVDQVESQMTQLLETLRRPAVRNLSIAASDPSLELTPNRLPDLYAGQPLTVLGRTDKRHGTLTVTGLVGERRWSKTVDLDAAGASPAVAKLWARRRITDIEADRTLGQMDSEEADTQIADIGLRYTLVTSQTSLVAVDDTVSRPADAPLTRADLPIELPAGWDFDALFGQQARGGSNSNAQAPDMGRIAQAKAFELPQTATNFATTIRWGLLMCLIGALGLIGVRRSRSAN